MAQPTKTELRKEFLAQRDALDPVERMRSSSLIRQRIFNHLLFKNSTVILCYVSFGSEVGTHELIQEMIRFKKQVVVPLHDPTGKNVPLSLLERYSHLGTSHRGVPQVQPAFLKPIAPAKIELALVPGIAFDRQCNRLGFGGGYFDRLLPKMPKAFRLGLAFSVQLASMPLPIETHDARLQSIVTEKEVVEWRAP